MKSYFPQLRAIAACIGLAIPTAIFAQQLTADNSVPDAPVVPAASSLTVLTQPATSTAKTPAWEDSVDRWLALDSFTYSARYRSVFDTNGAHSFDQGQQRLIAHGEFKFDPQGRYGVGFHLSSGRYFNWAYADFIGGGQHTFMNNVEAKSPFLKGLFEAVPAPAGFYNSGGAQLYFRQVFLTAEPVRGIEAQFGGFAINHGVNSEATSYDDDGYMTGERFTVRRPKQLWVSEVSYTRGFLGDYYTPNFFARGQSLAKSNYWQILGQKDFGKRMSISADYTATTPDSGVPSDFPLVKTTREGISADVHETRVFDKVHFEAYQRINGGSFLYYGSPVGFTDGKGYALTVTKDFKKRISVDAGIALIDADYYINVGLNVRAALLGLAVNGDQYGLGERYFVRPTIPLTKYVSLTGNYSQVYNDASEKKGGEDIWNYRGLNAGLVFDVKKMIFRSPAVQ